MSNQDIIALKKQLDDGQFPAVIEKCLEIIQSDTENKFVYLFLGQAYFSSNLLQANGSLATGMQKAVFADDEKLVIQYLKAMVKLGEEMFPKKEYNLMGQKLQIENREALVQIYKKQQKWKVYIEEVKTHVKFLKSQMQYAKIEEMHVEVYKNDKIETETRIEFGANIYAIDNYYNPKCDVEEIFRGVLELQPNFMENAQQLLKIATRFLKHIELKSSLKNMSFIKNLDNFDEFQQNLPLFMKACEIFYSQNQNQMTVQYAKYFNLKVLLDKYEEPQIEGFETALNDPENPHQEFCMLIKATKEIFEGFESPKTLENDQISKIEAKYGDSTFIPYLYKILKQDSSSITQCQNFVEKVEGFLGVKHTKVLVYLIKIQLDQYQKKPQKMTLEEYYESFTSLKQKLEVLDPSFDLSSLSYRVYLNTNRWKEALLCLDSSSSPQDHILSEKAWITYSYLDDIASDPKERHDLLLSASKMLLDASETNLEAKIRLGTIIHVHEVEMKNENTKWLQALKAQPGNHEIFYCLGLYYYLHQGDLKKGQNCIEKAISIKPNFFEAQYMLCVILISNGNFTRTLQIIEEVEKINRNLPFTYLFKGINDFKNGNYEIAIEHFQNSAKFYNAQKNQQDCKMRPNFPLLEDSIRKSQNPICEKMKELFGMFGQHKYTVTIWYYLTLCNHHIKKFGVAYKSLQKTMKELHQVLEKGENSVKKQSSKIIQYLEILSPEEQQNIIVKKEPDFKLALDAIACSDEQVVTQCYQFLELAAQIYIQHDPRKSVIASKYALKILEIKPNEENLDRIMQYVIDALYVQNIRIEKPVLEQNSTLEQRFREYLEKIVRECIQNFEEKFSVKLRFLVARSLLYISNQSDRQWALTTSLDQLDKLLKQQNNQLSKAQIHFIMLERAKLLYNLKMQVDAEKQILSLIKQDPENEKYWTFLHIFTQNDKPDLSKKALFKAYDINPSSSLVLNCLIAHYYRSKELIKFFRALQMSQKLNHFNPNIISILTLLNAQIALSGDIADSECYLLEAIYLVQSISNENIKEDFHMVQLASIQKQMLYDLLVILIVKQGDPKGQAIIKLREIYQNQPQIEKMVIMQMLQSSQNIQYQIQVLKKVFKDSQMLKMVEDNLMGQLGEKQIVQKILDDKTDVRLKKLYAKQLCLKIKESDLKMEISQDDMLVIITVTEDVETKVDLCGQFMRLIFDQLPEKNFESLNNNDCFNTLAEVMHLSTKNDLLQQMILQDFKHLVYMALIPTTSHQDFIKEIQIVHLKFGKKKEQQQKTKKDLEADWNEVKRTNNIYKTLRKISPDLSGLDLEVEKKEDYYWASEIVKNPTSFEGHVKALWYLISSKNQVDALKLLDVIKNKISSGIIQI